MNGTFFCLTGVAGVLSMILVTWLCDHHRQTRRGKDSSGPAGLTERRSADLILGKVERLCKRTSNSGH